MSPALLGILGYVLIQFAIVVIVVRRARRNSETDYLLAGRRVGPGLAMFTIFATWFGAAAAIAQHNLIVPLSAGEPT